MSRAWLIGAGPGDAELLTIKAMRALAQADVVLVDDLVNPDILQMAREDAWIVHVGKRGGGLSTPQHDIIALMLDHLRAGRSVARLKGGDPFVFGRGGEELQALQAASIPVDVICGITAGIAAPATLGIPVTHRGLAQGVILVTGQSAGDNEPDWRALAATGLTLVVYMGIRRLDEITASLLHAGMHPHTPCAVIESATLPAQRQILATLDTVLASVRSAGLGSPSILVIGRVASLANEGFLRGSPLSLAIGIGFRNEVTPAQIESAVLTALGKHTLDEVGTIATLDTKADHPALATFCEHHGIPLITFSASAIEACFDAHPTLHRSPAARQHVGVDGICEPCALLAAPGGNLLAGRYSRNGVTVAIAAMAESHCAHNE